ncbi:MAG: DUF5004 domain-containing protein [Cyclobacteriaceae bacterium]|nr:DUF5004 domain-containing protein [Cyclobacteriaceae bacterium]
MKTIKNIFALALIASVMVFPSCGGDDPGISFDEKMNGTWILTSVTVDGNDVTSDFTGFQLSLSYSGPDYGGGSYNITNANNILSSSGSYSLNGTTSMNLNGDDGSSTSATISLSADDTTLTFSFYNPTTTLGGGRVEGAAGDYVFVLNKQ